MRRPLTIPEIFGMLLLILGLVALIRCPVASIPDLVRALSTWWHISLRL
jgi:hypothetical protein